MALARAVRALKKRGGAAVIVAHRRSALAQSVAAAGPGRAPVKPAARAQPVSRAPTRDQQIARAIERVVGARPAAAAPDDTEALVQPGPRRVVS